MRGKDAARLPHMSYRTGMPARQTAVPLFLPRFPPFAFSFGGIPVSGPVVPIHFQQTPKLINRKILKIRVQLVKDIHNLQQLGVLRIKKHFTIAVFKPLRVDPIGIRNQLDYPVITYFSL
jgi:hypothetical protein